MPMFQNVPNPPDWYLPYLNELKQKVQHFVNRPYEPFKRLPPEKRVEYEREINELERAPVPEDAKYKVAVSPGSKPVAMSALEMHLLSKNPGLAEEAFYESADRYPNKGEMNLFNKRLEKKLQSIDPQEYNEEYQAELQKTRAAEELSNLQRQSLDYERFNQLAEEAAQGRLPLSEEAQRNMRQAQEQYNRLPVPPSSFPHNTGIYQRPGDHRNEPVERWEAHRREYEAARPSGDPLQHISLENRQRVQQLEEQERLNREQANPLREANRLFQERNQEKKEDGDGLPHPRERLKSLFSRARAPRTIQEKTAGLGTIAPRNQTHEQARGMLENLFDDTSLDESKQHLLKKADRDLERDIAPYYNAALQEPDQFVPNFVKKMEDEQMQSLKAQAEKEFLEDVMPRINNSFIQKGSFDSTARNQAIQKALQEQAKRLEHYRVEMRREGMRIGSDLHKDSRHRHLEAGKGLTHTAQVANDINNRTSEGLRLHGHSRQTLAHENVNQLERMGTAEQQQRQNEINKLEGEHYAREQHPMTMLQHERSFVQETPPPMGTAHFQVRDVPTAANPYNAGMGALGLMSGISPQQRQGGGFASGGHVRSRFAEGGAVEGFQKYQNMAEQQNLALNNELQSHRTQNPLQNWMQHVGVEALSNMRKDPLENLGRGTKNSFEHMESQEKEGVKRRTQAANLMNMMNESRFKQHKMLKDIGFNERTANREDRKLARQERLDQEGEKEMNASDNRRYDDAIRSIDKADAFGDKLNKLEKLAKKLETGPRIGYIHEGMTAGEDANEFQALANTLIIEAHQDMKNIPRSEEFMKRIESIKPSVRNYRKVNLQQIKDLRELVADIKAAKKETLSTMGKTYEGRRAQESAAQSDGKILVRNKETGKTVRVTPEEAAPLLEDGGERV